MVAVLSRNETKVLTVSGGRRGGDEGLTLLPDIGWGGGTERKREREGEMSTIAGVATSTITTLHCCTYIEHLVLNQNLRERYQEGYPMLTLKQEKRKLY